MRAKEVLKAVGYEPDELVLENVLTLGPDHADRGEDVYLTVGWQGTMLSIVGEVEGKEVMFLLMDDQVEELIKFWRSFDSKRQREGTDATE